MDFAKIFFAVAIIVALGLLMAALSGLWTPLLQMMNNVDLLLGAEGGGYEYFRDNQHEESTVGDVARALMRPMFATDGFPFGVADGFSVVVMLLLAIPPVLGAMWLARLLATWLK